MERLAWQPLKPKVASRSRRIRKALSTPDMPRSASAQFGSADFVLPPAQIAKELARIAGHPYVQRAQPEEESEPTAESQFAGIFQWVKRSTGVDFSQYKPSTLRRRILRRMVLHKMETVGSLSEAPGKRSL